MGADLELLSNSDQELALIKEPPIGATKIKINLDKVRIAPIKLVESPKQIKDFEITQYGQTHQLSRRTFFGAVCYDNKLTENALKHLQQQLDKHPDDPYALAYMAKHQFEQKQLDKATELAKKALSFESSLSMALTLLILINCARGEFSEAVDIFSQLQRALAPEAFKKCVQDSFNDTVYQCVAPQALPESFDSVALKKELHGEMCVCCHDSFSCANGEKTDNIVLVTPEGDDKTRAKFQPYHRLCLFNWISDPNHVTDPNTRSPIATISRFTA